MPPFFVSATGFLWRGALLSGRFGETRGCTATYFPEGNALLSINSVAERSNTPVSKFVVISVAKARNGGFQTADGGL
jgi:hypothetical protein